MFSQGRPVNFGALCQKKKVKPLSIINYKYALRELSKHKYPTKSSTYNIITKLRVYKF